MGDLERGRAQDPPGGDGLSRRAHRPEDAAGEGLLGRGARGLRALVFDVFGTVVDWRGGVIRAGEQLSGQNGPRGVDWPAFADAWRGRYAPSMDRVRRGELPWTKLDDLHRASLGELLAPFGLAGLDEAEKEYLVHAWHRLDPWPDAVDGLSRLKERYMIAPLSNGNVSLLVEMAKGAGLPWDLVLSAELVRRYKPDPEVYLMAPRLLDLRAEEVALVAAHPDDLRAAGTKGLKTVYVPRPEEWGPGERAEPQAPVFDLTVEDFVELADALGA